MIGGSLLTSALALGLSDTRLSPTQQKAAQDRLAGAMQDFSDSYASWLPSPASMTQMETETEAAAVAQTEEPQLDALARQDAEVAPLAALARQDAEVAPLDAVLEGGVEASAETAPEPETRTVAVGKGDTLIKLLAGVGIDRLESHEAVSALGDLFDPKRLQLGQEITLTLAREEDTVRLVGLNLASSVERSVEVQRQEDGGFAANEVVHEFDIAMARSGGVIEDSLFMTGQRAGIPAAVMVELVRLFSYDVDFQREVQRGDRFEVFFERFMDAEGRPVKEGRILFAEMALSGKATRYWRFSPDGNEADYFNEKGESVRKALLRTPIDGARLTSRYGMRRHPILGYSTVHKGIDFGAPSGTPIMAAGDGVLEKAGWNGGYGKYVRIRHNKTFSTAYAHLSKFGNGIRPGQRVRQGQIIGYVGTTGRSTGPHLHYEVLHNGKHVDPLSIRLAAGRNLEGDDLRRFRAMIQDLEPQIAATPLELQLASAD